MLISFSSALVRFSAPLLSFFQGVSLPAAAPFDASFCETAWLRAQTIAFEASVSGETSCQAGGGDLLTCSESRDSLYASTGASVVLIANYALSSSSAQLLLNGSQQTLSSAFVSSSSPCPPACVAGDFCSVSARCVAAPLGYWSIGNGSDLIACDPISGAETSPLVGYATIGMSSAACATGVAYQAVGSVDLASLSDLLPAEGT